MATTWLQVTNNAVTTLAASLTDAALEMDLTDISRMPVEFPFRLTIWDAQVYGWRNPAADPDMEIVEVTAYTEGYYYGGAWDTDEPEYVIVRGREGTSAAEHAAGDTVALLLTAGIVQQIQDAITALEP